MAEAAERFSDMSKYMTKLAQQKNQFYVEERNMLSVAYKNLVGARRSSWRTCRGLGSAPGYYTGLNQECVSEMQKKIEREIEQLSNEVSTVAEQLLSTNDGADNKVWGWDMLGSLLQCEPPRRCNKYLLKSLFENGCAATCISLCSLINFCFFVRRCFTQK